MKKKLEDSFDCTTFRQSTAHMISGPAHPSSSHGVVKVIDLQCDGWEEHVEQCTYISSGGCSTVGAYVQCFGQLGTVSKPFYKYVKQDTQVIF